MSKLTLNPTYNLYLKDGQAYCDSLQVADTFAKRHSDVLRAIENAMNVLEEIGQRNFAFTNFQKTTYKDIQNKRQPRYLLAKDGFAYIAMGFTGKEAARFKIEYITRFNQMEEFIKSLLTARFEFHDFTDAVKQAHSTYKPYHYSNEVDMIYGIVIGMKACKFRELHGLKSKESIRPYLTLEQIKAVENLQRADVGLSEAGLSYGERKEKLGLRYKRMFLPQTA